MINQDKMSPKDFAICTIDYASIVIQSIKDNFKSEAGEAISVDDKILLYEWEISHCLTQLTKIHKLIHDDTITIEDLIWEGKDNV